MEGAARAEAHATTYEAELEADLDDATIKREQRFNEVAIAADHAKKSSRKRRKKRKKRKKKQPRPLKLLSTRRRKRKLPAPELLLLQSWLYGDLKLLGKALLVKKSNP